MAGPILKDRTLESSTTTGTGTYTLAGVVPGSSASDSYQSFGAVGNGNTTPYAAWGVDANGNPSSGWEVGIGTYTASGTTLARTTITASSNAGAAVNWGAGTRYLGVVLPASAITTFALTLLDDADAATMRTTLGLGSLATQSGTFSGTSSGTNTGDQTSVTGNAGTATALATARNIDGQAFDGTTNITVIAPGTHAATSKATPVDADEVPLVDSAASNVLKRLTWANIKSTLFANPNIVGTATNDNAAAGSVGEYIESVVASASSVSLTTATTINITSISLTAGDWDVQGATGAIATNATTQITATSGSITATSATIDATAQTKNLHAALIPGNGITFDLSSLSRKRISISATTTIYLVMNATFTASTCGGFGRINARRVR